MSESFYQQHKIELEFKVAPHDDGSGNKIVDYVDVIVYVKDENGVDTVYQKERRVDLQNTVKYVPSDEATLYSDIAPWDLEFTKCSWYEKNVKIMQKKLNIGLRDISWIPIYILYGLRQYKQT